MLSDKANQAFFDSLPENIAASTDDNPFFFYTSRFSDFVSTQSWDIMSNNVAIGITGLLIIVALCACGYYIVLPFLRLARRMPMATLTPPVAYFSAIGMGFMLIEISQMQRLMVFLGHPVYGLSVVLFTILLFSGIGSATVGADTSSRSRVTVFRIAALLTTLVVAGLLTPLATTWARSLSTDMRILVSVLLLGILFILDAVKLTHRVVGPLYRFRKTIQALAAGEEVDPVTLRKDDFLQEMKEGQTLHSVPLCGGPTSRSFVRTHLGRRLPRASGAGRFLRRGATVLRRPSRRRSRHYPSPPPWPRAFSRMTSHGGGG